MAEAGEHVAVIGASGELGQALARALAREGARLSLWGRDPGRLAAISADCLALGATAAETIQADFSDAAPAIERLEAVDRMHPLDMVIFAQGLGDVRPAGAVIDDPATVDRLVRVNFLAPAAMAAAMAEAMARRCRGRIVFVGSAAAFHALPFAASYASSKAGLARFAEALHIAMEPHGVAVRLISPGFIDTAAGRRTSGPKPLLMTADQAAAAILRAARGRRFHSVLPWPFRLVRLFDRLMPRAVRGYLLRRASPPGLS